jgi:TPR repeat protein/AcrR family transcriptional regulator
MDQETVRKDVLRTARSLAFREGSDFTLASLCRESGLSRAALRKLYPTKAALIAALDQEVIGETLAQLSEARLQEAAQGGASTPQPDHDWVERRLRILERAIELLETRIETVSAEQSRLAAAQEEMNARDTPVPTPPPVMMAGPPITEPKSVELPPLTTADPLVVEEPVQFSIEPAPSVPPPAVEPKAPQILEDYVFHPAPAEPKVVREMLDNARALINGAAQTGSAQQTSELRNAKLVLLGAAAIVAVGLIIGLISVGGAARATQTKAPADTNAAIKAAGMTIINATGGVVPEQMTPVTKALAARAEKGDAAAQAELALAYLRGDGVVSNPAAAAGWAGLSATKGHAMGQFLLATVYNTGIKPDPHTGFRWMSAAALNGNTKAMHNVAIAFFTGSGIEKNPTEAANWFGKAAAKGYRDSAFDLAVLYERGEGVAQSTQRALYWYDTAAASGDKEAAQRASLLRFGVAELAGNLNTKDRFPSLE